MVGVQAQELSRRLQEALGTATASSAEAAQLQEILNVKADRLAALEAEAEAHGAHVAGLEAAVVKACAKAEAATAARAEGDAASRGLAQQLAALEGKLRSARAEAVTNSSSMEEQQQCTTRLVADLAASQAAGEAKDAVIAGGLECSARIEDSTS